MLRWKTLPLRLNDNSIGSNGAHHLTATPKLTYSNKITEGTISMHTHRITNLSLDTMLLESEIHTATQFRYSEAYNEFICGLWRSCMLWNKSGNTEDNFLNDCDTPAQITAYGRLMPHLVSVITSAFNLNYLRFARLATLTPGSVLIPHRDYLELKRGLTRIHIPLVTDALCFSAELNTVYQMKPGEVWFINATEIHSAANFSSKARTHLILDFCEVERIETILRQPVSRSAEIIPQENILSRQPLTSSTTKLLCTLSDVIDATNYKDVFALLIKKYFTTDLPIITAVDWMLEIARMSGNPEVIARVQWIYDHCLIKRQA